MKFKINEHPSILLFGISLIVLATTIVINVYYDWVFYSVIAIVLAGIAVLVLGYTMIKDISIYYKQKSQYYQNHPEEEEKDEDDEE